MEIEKIFTLEELLDMPELGSPYVNIFGHVYKVTRKNDDGTISMVKVAEFGPGHPIYDEQTERLRETVREVLGGTENSKYWWRTHNCNKES